MSTPVHDVPSPTPKRRSRSMVALLVVLVGCSAYLLLSYLKVWETTDPTRKSVKALGSWTDVDTKIAAARDLAMAKNEELPYVIPALLAALDDPAENSRIRAYAARSLGHTGNHAMVADQNLARLVEKSLAKALVDPDPEIQGEAANDLLAMRSSGVKDFPFDLGAIESGLTSQLKSTDENVRRTCASVLNVLGSIPGNKLSPLLITIFQNDPSIPVRLSAASSLPGFTGEPDRVMTVLFEGLKQPDKRVQQQCADSLARLKPTEAALPELLEHLKGDDRVVRGRSATLLGQVGSASPTVFSALLALVKEHKVNTSQQPSARVYDSELAEINPSGEAATSIGLLAPKLDASSLQQAADALRPLLDDSSINLRGRVMRAIGELGPASWDIIPRLEALQKDDPEPFIKQEAGRVAGILKAARDKK